MIDRILQAAITAKMVKGKVIIVVGPRQVGKTTLVKTILKDEAYLFLDGDDPTVRNSRRRSVSDPRRLRPTAFMGKPLRKV